MKIVSIAVSRHKGTTKKQVESVDLLENQGIAQDAHAGDWHRQVSFLAAEEIDRAKT